MNILIKLVNTAVVEKTVPKRVLNRYLMAYRATPDRMTRKSQAELMFGRQIQTKVPRILPKAQGKATKEAKQT